MSGWRVSSPVIGRVRVHSRADAPGGALAWIKNGYRQALYPRCDGAVEVRSALSELRLSAAHRVGAVSTRRCSGRLLRRQEKAKVS